LRRPGASGSICDEIEPEPPMSKPRVDRWIVLALGVTLCAGALAAQTYPTRPVRLITAPIGGGNDFMARMISQALSNRLGQQLVVDNRPANVMAEIVAKAPGDGYTLLVIGSALWLAPFMQDTVGYDPVKDFAPISLTGRSVNILVVHPSIGVSSAKELIAAAKSKPGQLNYATGATGTSNHVAGELFKHMAGIELVRIAYKGSGPALNDLIGGQVQIMFPTTAAGLPHVKSNRLRALGVTSLQRTPLAPGLPTVAETGLPGYESLVIYSLVAPAQTPAPIVARLHAELAASIRAPAIAERLLNSGIEVVASTPRELAATMASESKQLGKLIRDARLHAN
jgi:tripartite-type tricarboxylate transporter receptor subunit TctC